MFILNFKDRRCHKWYATILFLFLSVSYGFSQEVEVSGTVTDVQNGTPIPGVSVFAKDTSIGTSTDFDGNYTLSVPEDAVLVFSYIGFNTQEIPVGDSSVINVRLEESLEQLSEVVVIGYGVQKKELVTGANLQVEGESLEKQNTTNALQAFEFMLETAQCVVRNLGGELKDERRSVMTPQTIEHCRQRIREFERKQRSQRA